MFLLKFNIESHNFQCCLILKISLGHIFYSGSLTDVNAFWSNPVACLHNVTSLPLQVAPQDRCFFFHLCYCSEEMKGTFRQMNDLELLKDALFLICHLEPLHEHWLNVPYTYVPVRVAQVRLDSAAD